MIQPAPTPAATVLSATGIVCAQRVQQVDISLKAGELTVLLGANGAGKSTLLKALAGELAFSADRLALPAQLSYLPQSRECAWSLTCADVVALGLLPDYAADAAHPHVNAVMSDCDCLQFADTPIHTLSGGEQARVLLARALVSKAPLLLADEPLAALDPAHQLAMMTVLQRHAHIQGKAVLLVLHDIALAARFADQVMVLKSGRMLASGCVDEVLTQETLLRAFGVEFAVDLSATPPRIQALRLPA